MKVIIIGRAQDNDIVVNDDRVSRNHLQIVQDNNGNCSVVDLGSSNGTFVNGQRITSEVRLQANDVVKIGSTTLPWQSYFVTQKVSVQPPTSTQTPIIDSPKPKRTFWYILVVVVILLLAGGGVYWKISHDKKVEIEVKAEEEKKQEAKKIEEAAIEADKKAKEAELRIEEQARKEAQKREAEEKTAKEKATKEATENQKKKDKTDFENLKIEVEKLKSRGANPAEKLIQMKRIADKYPADTYFSNAIKNLEK